MMGCAMTMPGGMAGYKYIGNGLAQDEFTGEIRQMDPSFDYSQTTVFSEVPDSWLVARASGGGSGSMSSSVPGSTTKPTTVGEDIQSGVKSFFGVTGEVTKGVMENPLGQMLVLSQMSRLVPGMGRPQAPPPPPPAGPSMATVALVGVGIVGAGAIAYAASKSSSPRKTNPRRRRRLRRGR